jgi:cytochrome c551/c552
MKKLTLLTLALAFNAMALTPEAEKGKASISACLACHNAELTPSLAPPFYGVQNKYKQAYSDKQSFITAISDWAKHPSEENALMKRPIQMLGLMPAMPLPDEMLAQIGAYLYEESFDPPCTHWANDLKNSSNSQPHGQGLGKGMGRGQGKGMGQGGNHNAMIQMKYNQLCK